LELQAERKIGGIFILEATVRKHWLVFIALLLSLSTSLIGCSSSTTAHRHPLTPTTIAILTIPETHATGNSKSVSIKTVLDGLVKDGTITMAQQVIIETVITTANQDAAANGDFNAIDICGSQYVMDGLVKDGTITAAQQVVIQRVMTTAKEDGTLTKDPGLFEP